MRGPWLQKDEVEGGEEEHEMGTTQDLVQAAVSAGLDFPQF